jgi:hypothetical protein
MCFLCETKENRKEVRRKKDCGAGRERKRKWRKRVEKCYADSKTLFIIIYVELIQ